MPKEKPKVNIGEVIRTYRGDRGLSQGDIERRTGLLRCYLSRVENGHTVPSLETLAKIAEAMEISLADFFPGSDTLQDRETRKVLGELSDEEIRFLADIKKYSTTLSDDDKKLVLAMIRKMATVIPPPRNGKTVAPLVAPNTKSPLTFFEFVAATVRWAQFLLSCVVIPDADQMSGGSYI